MERKLIEEKISLVVDKLMHLGKADENLDKTVSREKLKQGLIARDFGIEEWDWPQGVGLYGLVKIQAARGTGEYDAFLENWFRTNIEIGLPSRNINTTAPFLALMDLVRRKGDKTFEDMCRERAEWLMTGLPRAGEGAFQHVTSAIGDRNGVTLNEGQVWADTLFMAVLFLNQAGQHFGRLDWVEESERQFLVHIKYLYDKKAELFHHGWTFDGRHNFGEVFWCRGNSWYTCGVVDYLGSFTRYPLGEGVKTYLVDTLASQAGALRRLQAGDGMWHTVLDDPGSYTETSGTAAIAAGLAKAVKLGLLDESYRSVVKAAVEGVVSNIAEDGTVLNVSAGTGIGMDKDHYRNIIRNTMAYGQSLTLLALAEYLDLAD